MNGPKEAYKGPAHKGQAHKDPGLPARARPTVALANLARAVLASAKLTFTILVLGNVFPDFGLGDLQLEAEGARENPLGTSGRTAFWSLHINAKSKNPSLI